MIRKVRVSAIEATDRRRIRREVLRRGLDRRKVYCLTIDGQLGTHERFTGVCSGCRCDCRDGYPCSHGAGGCDECGYTGKRVTWFGVPVAAVYVPTHRQEPPMTPESLLARARAVTG